MAGPVATSHSPPGLKALGQVLHPLFSLAAVVCLLALVGWTGNVAGWEHQCTIIIGAAFAIERIVVFLRLNPRDDSKRRLGYHALLGLVVLGVSVKLLLGGSVAESEQGSLGWHVFVLGCVLVSGLVSMIYHQTSLTARAFHPGLVLIGSFIFIIAVGALLLKMPRCVVRGADFTWLEAIFTSTSAVCVTGLAVENTAMTFSLTGQCVILLLIQVGGLGIMTLTFFAAIVLFEGLSLHDRLLLGRMIQENRLARIGRTLGFIVGMTLAFEALGAAVLFMGMDVMPDWRTRLFHSVFHSVSAFCNAGFSTLPDGMASPVMRENHTWQIVIMLLIVVGGIGALVVEDLTLWSLAKLRRIFLPENPRPRLRIHTRLVLLVTSILIVAGAGLILATEYWLWKGPENGGRVITALFHSVTTRTAGFNTVSMSQIGPLTVQVMIILMLIGGSPGGTAGGLRTTVVAVGIAHLWSMLRSSRRGMVVFNRTIPADTGANALGVLVLGVLWLTVNFIILQMLQAGSGIPETALLFELVSAFATVGLSLDHTPTLTDGAKILLIINMFVGRIGLLSMLSTFIPPDKRPSSGRPQENILLN